MSTDIDRARSLVNLAADERTPREEARTAAMMLVKMISGERVKLVSKEDASSFFSEVFETVARQHVARQPRSQGFYQPPGSRPPPDPTTRRRWPEAGPTPQGRPAEGFASRHGAWSLVEARASGFCPVCNDTYVEGERVAFDRATREISHVACFKARRAGRK